MKKLTIISLILLFTDVVYSQITAFPYKENFDTVTVPNLPFGWTTTTNKSVGGDFTSSTSSPRTGSLPNCLSATDARFNQIVVSPQFNFTGIFVDSLEFYERRTGTFTAGLLLEASIANDTNFSIKISDTLFLTGANNGAYQRRIVALPETLNNQSNVKFRWRVVGIPSGGATAILRLEDVTVSKKKATDLSLTNISVSPSLPKKGENLSVSVKIKNNAMAGSFSGSVQLFDSLTLVVSENYNQSFAANDSLTIVINYPAIKAGRHPLTAKLILTGDEDTTNNSISLVVNAGYQPRTMVINEIMYVPATGVPEWIEVINNSADTIPISGWRISDATTNRAVISPTNRMVVPYSFFVITTDTTTLKNLYTITSPLFQAPFSALNNTGDAVVLFDPTLSVIDSLTYATSWGGSVAGKSMEKIDTAFLSTVQANWTTSLHPSGATPGKINSVTQKTFDVSVRNVLVAPQFPVVGNPLTVSLVVKNLGKQNLSSLTFELYLDANKDSVLAPNELQSQQNIASLNTNDSVSVQTNITSLAQGTHWFFAKILSSQDEDTTNNLFFASVTIGIAPKSIVVNEIMYAPTGDMPEWIEGYNNTASTINIGGWRISDNGTTKALIQSASSNVSGGTYFIFTPDTNSFKNFYPSTAQLFQAAIPTLNNTTPDAVVLFDERGATMDSIYYKQSWGGTNGNSLQRFDIEGNSTDSSNWRSQLPTPAIVNSIIKRNIDARVKRIQLSPAQPTVNQQMTASATIENIGKQSLSNITVEFYLDTNNDSIPSPSELKSQQIISSLTTADSTTLTAQFFVTQSGSQRVFIKIVSASDEESSNNVGVVSLSVGVASQSIVINEIMYNPTSDISEWVEFYNKSASSISIAGWRLSDNGTTKATITNSSVVIPAQTFFIVTTDSTFYSQYSVSVPVFIASFSALNNTTPDAVVLFDNQNRMIDSVYYRTTWGGTNGNSLQRFDVFSSSTDSANWRSAVPSAGSVNSIARKDFDVELRNTTSTKTTIGSQIKSTVRNLGRQSANSTAVKFYYDSNRDSIAQTNEQIHSFDVPTIAPLDSFVVSYDWNVAIQGSHRIFAIAEFAADERLENNSGTTVVTNSFPAQSLVINEIMYEPKSGNTEFIEILNRSTDTIDVMDWKLMDQPSSTGSRANIFLSRNSLLIPPGGFVLVAGDSSLYTQFPSLAGKNIVLFSSLSLSNSGEDLVLVDLTNTQIDSVRYIPLWHLKNVSTPGRSLERINPSTSSNDSRNWSSSVSKSGASAGEKNSIFVGSASSSSSLALSPNPFSPDNDGFEDFLSINYSLPTNSSMIRIRIFDATGRLIRRLAQNELTPSTGTIIWDGLDDDAHRIRIGMYIVLFEALDNFGGVVQTMKDVAVVGRKL